MGFLKALFSFEGRASRYEFWAIHATTIALQVFAVTYVMLQSSMLTKDVHAGTISLSSLSTRNFIDSLSINRSTLLIILLTPLLMQFAVAWRRLHDRDKSGGWAIAMLLPIVLALFLNDIRPGMTRPNDVDLLAIVAATWYFVELGILEGSPGANSYAPRRQVSAAIEEHAPLTMKTLIVEDHPPLPGRTSQGAEEAMDRAIAERRMRRDAGEAQVAPAFVDRRTGKPDTREVKVERRSGRDRRAGAPTQGFGRRSA